VKKRLLFSVVAIWVLAPASWVDLCQWPGYPEISQRTGYSVRTGSDASEVLWRINIPGDFDTSPFIINDTVVLLWKDNMYHLQETKIILLDLLTGEILEELKPDENIFKVFPVNQKILGISGDNIYEFNLTLKETILLASVPEKSFAMTNMYPLILEDRIILPTTPVTCLSQIDYHTLWNLKDSISEKVEPLSLAGDESLALFIMTSEKGLRIFALNPETGLLRWKSDHLPAALWLALKEDTIFCGGNNLWAFDRKGNEQWVFIPEGRIVSNIVVGPDAVYFADESHHLYKVDFGGSLMWKTSCEVSPWYYETHLVRAGNILYCIGNFGDPVSVTRSWVDSYSVEDGKRVWDLKFEDIHYIKASPAVADTILVMGKIGGEVLALSSDPDMYVTQGDTFLSEGCTERAITSYRRAAEFYAGRGNVSRSQEIEAAIRELQSPSESALPETATPTTPPESTPQESLPPDFTSSSAPSKSQEQFGSFVVPLILFIVVIGAVALIWKKKGK
jgi:outer membrane protein assembly factor BamB